MEIGLKIKHLLNKVPNDLPTKALSWLMKVVHFLGFVASVILVFVHALVIFTWGDFPFSEQINYIREHDLGRGELIPFIFLPLLASWLNHIMFRFNYKLGLTTGELLPEKPTTFFDAYGLIFAASLLVISLVGLVCVFYTLSPLIGASLLLFFLPVFTWVIWRVYEWIVEEISRKQSENDPKSKISEDEISSSNSILDLLDAKKLADIMIV